MLGELGGFAVLGAKFIAFLVVLLIGGAVVWITARKGTTVGKKVLRGAAAAVVMLLIVAWDEIAGRAYFHHLCTNQSGVRVFKQVTLGPDYRDLKFPDASWLYKKLPLANAYPYSLDSKEDLPGPARIRYVRHTISDGKTGETLGTLTNYFYGGGWFENAFSIHGAGGGSCDLGPNYFKKFLEQVYVVNR